jgi:hypothetical protein
MTEKDILINSEHMIDDDLSLDEYSIVELEDRLEFVLRCDNRCNAN